MNLLNKSDSLQPVLMVIDKFSKISYVHLYTNNQDDLSSGDLANQKSQQLNWAKKHNIKTT